MRDDIHKRVPRPALVQRWVKRCVNDADRLNGRSLEALTSALQDYCSRELSEPFIRNMRREVSGNAGMFAPLEIATSVRQLGGANRPLELEVYSETRRLLAHGLTGPQALREAIASTLERRCLADIRATEPVLPFRDPKTPLVLGQMRADVGRVDFRGFADALCVAKPYGGPADGGVPLAETNLIQNFKPKVVA